MPGAWKAFCTDLGVAASDTDRMLGLPFMGGGDALDLIKEVVGEVAPDEEYQQQCHGHMTQFWSRMVSDRDSG